MVFTQHFIWYQESKGDVLSKQDYPLDRTQTRIPECLGKDLWYDVPNHIGNGLF